ncbi:MAG: hypothetical protein JSW73_04845 [Candidatus Woesearchaeota archaeon]|nr:MAG: hypothetical protein JSW73_04845 [Candidatus Woesearchaeota archaeon]
MKRADMPITPLIILILTIIFLLLALFFITGVLPTSLEEVGSYFNKLL